MYAIHVKPAFERAFDKLTKRNKPLAVRLRSAIDELRANPRPDGCKKLEGVTDAGEDVYRIRVGDLRILYVIRDRQLIVLLVDVRDRKEAYR
jgi:mRNA interferase RelE/StbE